MTTHRGASYNTPFFEQEFYEGLGLKSGLEVHQQLMTEKKLFCRCPAGLYSDVFHTEILRHMRPTLSELGEYDGTALMEFRTRKEIIYRLNNESVCTYEMDDAPPFELNEEALKIALEIAMLLECNLVSEAHVARKQYLDGSIPTGFQRTTIVGVDGSLPVGGKRVGIFQLGLEEDACREIQDVGHIRVFRTDRLGMPLIEVVTAPELHTPWEAGVAGQAIRALTRSTGKVRTGIGATRQDVNVSIEGGTRVEIKGVPRIPRIPYLVHNEAMRQKGLLEIRDELARRNIKQTDIKPVRKSVTDLLKNTNFEPIRNAIEEGLDVHAVRCNGFAGLMKKEIQPGTPFLYEISERVRVVACLDQLPNVACSDFEGENLTSEEWREVRKAIVPADDDAIVLVWGKGLDLVTAAEEIEGRAKEAIAGVPNETRQALPDNRTGFERVLPGPDRMYPDTDLPPLVITEEELEAVRSQIGVTGMRWQAVVESYSLSPHFEISLYRHGFADLFIEIMKDKRLQSAFVASILTDRIAARVEEGSPSPEPEEIKQVFAGLAEGALSKDAVKLWADGKKSSVSGAMKKGVAYSGIGQPTEADIKKILETHQPSTTDEEAILNFYVGLIKKSLGMEIPGSEIKQMVRGILYPSPSSTKGT